MQDVAIYEEGYMKTPVREVMSVIYQFRDSEEPEQELNLWDVDCAAWLKKHAHQCRILKVEPMKWEPIHDTSSGAFIQIIKSRATKKNED